MKPDPRTHHRSNSNKGTNSLVKSVLILFPRVIIKLIKKVIKIFYKPESKSQVQKYKSLEVKS